MTFCLFVFLSLEACQRLCLRFEGQRPPGWGCRGAQHPPARAGGAKRDFFMKTYRNFYHQIYDFENLYRAYRAARRAKRDRAEVAQFAARVEDHLFQLQAELRAGTYQPGDYRQRVSQTTAALLPVVGATPPTPGAA
jgi:hypothetical protein